MSTEQHGFTITVEVIQPGTFAEAFAAAMHTAESFYAEVDTACVVVRETGLNLFSGTEGVFCEGCEGHVFPGVRWPTSTNGDDSREWVERCDRCERYESDEAAADAVREHYPDDAVTEYGQATPSGCIVRHPYVSIGVS